MKPGHVPIDTRQAIAPDQARRTGSAVAFPFGGGQQPEVSSPITPRQAKFQFGQWVTRVWFVAFQLP